MERLNILLKNHVISKQVFNVCKNIYLDSKNWETNDQNKFLMHLAMALKRIEKNEDVDSLSDLVVNQLKSNSQLNNAEKHLDEWLKSFPYQIPANEKWFLIMHIINHLEKSEKK